MSIKPDQTVLHCLKQHRSQTQVDLIITGRACKRSGAEGFAAPH